MGIDAATSVSSSSQAAQTSQVSGSASSESTKKTSSNSSFKKEMDKVSSEDKVSEKENTQNNQTQSLSDKSNSNKDKSDNGDGNNDNSLSFTADYSKFASMAVQDANMMLSNDIMQMVNTTNNQGIAEIDSDMNVNVNLINSTKTQSASSVFVSESDAQFFLNLTQNANSDNITMNNVITQAQTALSEGAEAANGKQNVQVSQTLLNALSSARENNQPLRIDFDQNVSVILRVGKDGAISANFIPGDKAVEQYLKNNISSLRAVFTENDIPYSDLSYSNSSKQQNEKRRNQQQGDK